MANTIVPNLTMNESLAYLVGLLKGDGSVKIYKVNKKIKPHNIYLIQFAGQEKKIVSLTFNILKQIGLNPSFYYINKDRTYHTAVGNKLFANWYLNLNLKEILNNSSLKIAFLRGFYEAEGSYFFETGRTFPYSIITNCNEELIKYIFNLIRDFGFDAKLYKMKRCKTAFKSGFYYQLKIRKKGEANKFIEFIKPSIKNIATNTPISVRHLFISHKNYNLLR